nr:hypothetical protein [uncultured Oscillibacter sp.]
MKSKAPLILMEQMVMLLVFALAAALCLQAFAKSDSLSSRSEARDKAAALCQTAAETVRHYGGSAQNALSRAAEDLGAEYSEEFVTLSLDYDENWNPIHAWESGGRTPYYRLWVAASPDPADPWTVPSREGADLSDPDLPGLQRAAVRVITGHGNADQMLDTLFTIDIAWQEVSAHD